MNEMDQMFDNREDCGCPTSCERNCVQTFSVEQPINLTPDVRIDTPVVRCGGLPQASCESLPNGGCTWMISQEISITLPIRFGAQISAGEASVSCDGEFYTE